MYADSRAAQLAARQQSFSCSRSLSSCFGLQYMSPELFQNKPYNNKSDVWALGEQGEGMGATKESEGRFSACIIAHLLVCAPRSRQAVCSTR